MNYNVDKIESSINSKFSKAFLDRNYSCVNVVAVNTKNGRYASEPNQVRVSFRAYTYSNNPIKYQVFSKIDSELDMDKVEEARKEFVADVLHREKLEKNINSRIEENRIALKDVQKMLDKKSYVRDFHISTYAGKDGIQFSFTVNADNAQKIAELLASM